jgi:hypothetical protein
MSVNIDNKQVKELLEEVEKIVGKISGHNKFIELTSLIEEKCKEHVSITTLERLWGYSTRNANNMSERILDIIAKFVDAKDWHHFCHTPRNKKESELFRNDGVINCSKLEKGTRLRLGWMPDRICEIEYLGNNRFIATRTENTSIKQGDSFSCLLIQKGRELYMDYFTHSGEIVNDSNARYVVGQINGLSIVEFI